MEKDQPCCGEEHTGHLCVLVSQKAFDRIEPLVRHPRYICFQCGRVADSAKHLCNPMPLKS